VSKIRYRYLQLEICGKIDEGAFVPAGTELLLHHFKDVQVNSLERLKKRKAASNLIQAPRPAAPASLTSGKYNPRGNRLLPLPDAGSRQW